MLFIQLKRRIIINRTFNEIKQAKTLSHPDYYIICCIVVCMFSPANPFVADNALRKDYLQSYAVSLEFKLECELNPILSPGIFAQLVKYTKTKFDFVIYLLDLDLDIFRTECGKTWRKTLRLARLGRGRLVRI